MFSSGRTSLSPPLPVYVGVWPTEAHRAFGRNCLRNDMSGERDVLYRLIVESAHEGIWVADGAGNTTYVNRRMAEMLGYSAREMQGRSIYDFVPPGRQHEAQHEFDLLRERSRDQYELPLLK